MNKIVAAALLALAGCASTPAPVATPIVETRTVPVPVPVPCKVLAELGEEPAYPDSDEALRAAPDIFEQVKLLLRGRLTRMQRLARYDVARVACSYK